MQSGDLIKARVKIFPLLFHYGIVTIRNGSIFIMHNTPGRGTVIDSLDDFLLSRELIYSESTWLNSITEEELQNRFDNCAGDFNLISYNCEHFIDCMLMVDPESEQLSSYLFAIALLFLFVFIIAKTPIK